MSSLTPSTLVSAWIALAYQEQGARQRMDQVEANPNATEKEKSDAHLHYKNITVAMWEIDFILYKEHHVNVLAIDLGFPNPTIRKEDMIPGT